MSALADSRCAVPLTITLHPSATVWSSASKATRPLITALNSLVPWAVRKSTVRRWVTKLTGKISGCPPRTVTNRPNDTLDSKLQLSSSLSTVTGSSADMIQPNALGMLEKLPGDPNFLLARGLDRWRYRTRRQRLTGRRGQVWIELLAREC